MAISTLRRKFSCFLFGIVSRLATIVLNWFDRQRIAQIRKCPNLKLGNNVNIYGVPTFIIHKKATIRIGDGVLLNSTQAWCLVGAYGPVRLLANHAGAVIEIGARTRFHASCIRAYQSVKIGSRCLIASNCQIMDAGGHTLSFHDVERRIDDTILDSKPIVIEDDVWLCEGVKVLPGVTIGKGAVIGVGSVVTNNVPPCCYAVGIPARVVKQILPDFVHPEISESSNLS